MQKYGYIKHKEKEIIKLKEEGFSYREIGEKLGFTQAQIKEFFHRLHKTERKQKAGYTTKKKGRPPKEYTVTEEMKVQELKYIIARKDSKIKALEMENELMRDFLSLIGRK